MVEPTVSAALERERAPQHTPVVSPERERKGGRWVERNIWSLFQARG